MANNAIDQEAYDRVRGYYRDRDKTSLEIATGRDPDRHAEDLRLSQTQDLPVDTVERNRDEVERRDKVRNIDLEGYKRVREYFRDPDNASVSIDDIEPLKQIEGAVGQDEWWQNAMTDVGIGLFSGGMTLTEMIKGEVNFWTGGWAGYAAEEAGLGFLGKQKELAERVKREGQTKAQREADAALNEAMQAGGASDVAKALWNNPRSLLTIIPESVAPMIAISATAKSYATSLLNKEGLVAGTRAANEFLKRPEIKRRIVAAAAASEGALVQGISYQEAIEEGVDPLKAGLTSIGSGLSTALISQQLGRILPDVEATAAISSLTKGASAKKAVEAVKSVGKQTAKESLEEGLQEPSEEFWMNIATGDPLTQGLGAAAVIGSVAGGGAGSIMATTTEISSAMRATDNYAQDVLGAYIEQEQLDNVIAGSQASKTNERSKERFEGYMQSLGEDRMVYITQEAAAQITDPPEYILEQLDPSGTDVAIPLKKFAADLAPNQGLMSTIRPHIRLSEYGLTMDEMQSGDVSSLKKLLERANKNADTKATADRIQESVTQQLVDTGRMSEAMARVSSAIIPAYLTTYVDRARKAGDENITIEQVYEQFYRGKGIRIVGPTVDVGADPGTIVDQPGEPLYDQGQDFGDLAIEMTVAETGETQAVKAQDAWDETQDRRTNLQQLLDCLAA